MPAATMHREPMRFSDLAQASLRAAAELAEPRPTGADEMLAAVATMSQDSGNEAQELLERIRWMGLAAAPLRRVALSEPRSEESIASILDWADTLREAEGADEITCSHLLLAAIAEAPPGLRGKLEAASAPTETLLTRALTNRDGTRDRAPSATREHKSYERYQGLWFDHRYEVLGGAQGGMGCVLFCQDLETRQAVAVKLCRRPESADLFLEEAQKWIVLGVHPHIVQALYAGRTVPEPVSGPLRQMIPVEGALEARPTAEPAVYIVLEMIARSTPSGCSLRDWLHDTPGIPSAALLRWACQIAQALEFANTKHGLIHQDVKPENILITPAGDAKLTDFGVATRLGSGQIHGGTPIYMAPEHRAGRPSVQSDVYSLGMTLAASLLPHMRVEHLALAGGPERPATISEQQLALLIGEGRPADERTSTGLCREMARFIKTCTNADPTKRYDGFGQVQHALAELAHTHLGVTLEKAARAAEGSSADLTNRAISLLRLRGNAEADQAIGFLAEALAESPDNYIALDWLRRCCVKLLNDGQVLRLAWLRWRLSWRLPSRRPWLLAQTALLATVLCFSPAPVADKFGAVALTLTIGGEAYVRHFSDLTLKWFSILTYAVCGMLYVTQGGTQPKATPGGTFIAILAAMGAWVALNFALAATGRFLVRRSERLQRRTAGVWKRTGLNSTRFVWNIYLPISVALGAGRREIFTLLYPYVSLALRYVFSRRAKSYIQRQKSRGVFLGQAQELDLTPSQRAQRSGYPLAVSVLVVLLYGPWLTGVAHWSSFWRLEAVLAGWTGLGLLARRDEADVGGER